MECDNVTTQSEDQSSLGNAPSSEVQRKCLCSNPERCKAHPGGIHQMACLTQQLPGCRCTGRTRLTAQGARFSPSCRRGSPSNSLSRLMTRRPRVSRLDFPYMLQHSVLLVQGLSSSQGAWQCHGVSPPS